MKTMDVLFILGSVSLVGCEKALFQAKLSKIPSAQNSLMKVSTPNVADGQTASEVTLVLKNDAGEVLPDVQMNLTVTGDENVIVPCSVSDTNGIARCRVYSTTAEVKTYVAAGAITLTKNVPFDPARPYRSLMNVVGSGDMVVTPAGQKIVTSAALVEAPVVLRDANGVMRVHTSVQGGLYE